MRNRSADVSWQMASGRDMAGAATGDCAAIGMASSYPQSYYQTQYGSVSWPVKDTGFGPTPRLR